MAVLTVALIATAAPAHAASPPPPQLPAPSYKTVSKEVLVPMDDGVRLAATVAFPSVDGEEPARGRFPVVLEMTPYGREGICGCTPGADFAARGIIGAVVDVRGTGGSEGSLKDNYFSPREQRDGYELVEYFGTRPYSSGRVGMTGGSYVGITQYLTAEQRPPHLSVITPIVSLSDLYREGYTHDGIPNFFFDAQYLGVQQPAGYTGVNTDPGLFQETVDAKIDQATGGTNVPFDYLSRPNDGPFYRDRSPIYRADRIRVPVLIYDGWHDGFIFGANEMYRLLSQRRNVETRLYVDPCTHKGCGPPFDPETNPSNLESPEAVVFEFLRKYLVPGAQSPARSLVRVYVQGKGDWMDATRWPPPESRATDLYLAPSGLSSASPGARTTQSYVTNPAAGLSMSFDQYGTVAASPYVPLDQRLAEEAGVTWRTPPLADPLTLTGGSALHLVASSSASDTDWFAKLSDVAPDGGESIVTAGFLRASHRALDRRRSTPDQPWHTNTDPTPIEPGRWYDYDLAVWPTAYQLAPGHRLQLRVTSFDFPTHLPGTLRVDPGDPSSASFVPLSPATNTIAQGGSDPSYLRLTAVGEPSAPARSPTAGVSAALPALRR
ncbi:MAG: CocE/NonD family hydrolase [Thermoleophilaceae bacterium]